MLLLFVFSFFRVFVMKFGKSDYFLAFALVPAGLRLESAGLLDGRDFLKRPLF